jgi:hypothetical protein
MKPFDRRWEDCVRVARRATPRPCAEPPLHLAPALRRALRSAEPGPEPEPVDWWRWYGTRGLAVASVLFVACLFFGMRDRRDAPSLRPGVEDAVAEVLWRL